MEHRESHSPHPSHPARPAHPLPPQVLVYHDLMGMMAHSCHAKAIFPKPPQNPARGITIFLTPPILLPPAPLPPRCLSTTTSLA